MKIIFFALIVTMIFVSIFIPLDVLGYSFVAVTDNGVTFPITVSEINSSNSSDTGDSILDGLGVYLAIQNINTNGKVYFGSGNNIGSQTDIRQYVGIGVNDDWVIAITDDDAYETIVVPEFGKQYQYDSGSLIDVSSSPNILGYLTSKNISGMPSVSLNNDGIIISGTGTMVMKLNSYSDGMLIRGTLKNTDVKIVTSPLDLNTISMSGNNYVLYENTSPSVSLTNTVRTYHQNVCAGGCMGGYYTYEYYHSVTSTPNITVASDSDLSSTYDYNLVYYTTASCGSRINPHCQYSLAHSNVGSLSVAISSSSTTDGLLVTSLSSSYVDSSLTTGAHSGSGTKTHTLLSTTPWNEQYSFDNNFEQYVELPNNSYIVASLNDGNVVIKGENFNPNSDVFFQVDGLPSDVAYDITKNGITGVIGKTSSTGEISLLHDDVDFGLSSSPGGILKIYPDSAKYLGNFGVRMFDLYNGCTISLPTGEDLAYIPQNYVRWVFPVAIEVENVQIDNISLNCLNNNYTKNDALLIPVIPGASTIYATIDDKDVEVSMKDVATTTQIKQVPQKSSTSSDHSTSGAVYTTSNISTSTFLTATHTGVMNINIDLKVGGSADFSMDASYTGESTSSSSCKWSGASSPYRTYSCRSYSLPSNPGGISNIDSLTSAHQSQLTTALNNGQVSQITVEVDIFKNLQYVKTVLISTSNSAQASVTSTLSEAGYGASNQIHVTYPLTSISENIAISVDVGDMMEFVVRVNLEASGVPTPSSVDGRYSSYVKTTTEFGGGVITVGMS